MNISCEVIKDLLPLYHDGVCSDESKTTVDEHLAHCEKCKAELLTMAVALPIGDKAESNLREAEAVRQLSKRWRKGMLASLFRGVIITVAAIAAIALILYVFVGVRIV